MQLSRIRHWTPRYVIARGRVIADQRLHPTHPWLTSQSVKLLSGLLQPDDTALEFGSGRSTRWFAKRVGKLTSVEHDKEWHRQGLERLKIEAISNVYLLLRPMDVPESDGSKSGYVQVAHDFADGSVDFCLVDGMYRGACALAVVPKLRQGGFMAIDNAGWFLPSTSRTPAARAVGTGGYDADWDRFIALTSSWRRIWTTSGVTDTVLMFKR